MLRSKSVAERNSHQAKVAELQGFIHRDKNEKNS
jgi:hypothetical protein